MSNMKYKADFACITSELNVLWSYFLIQTMSTEQSQHSTVFDCVPKQNLNLLHFVTTLYNVCSVHRGGGGGDTMNKLGEYHEFIRGCSVHLRYIMMYGGIP